MTLPTSLRAELSQYVQPFGGLRAIEEELPEEKLADIALHNGTVLTVNANLPAFTDDNADPIDLTAYGFTPGGSYVVYDEDGNYLYRQFSQKGFGTSRADRVTVEQTPHAHYFQILFPSPTPRRLIMWIVRRPNQKEIRKRIGEARRVRDLLNYYPNNKLILYFGRDVLGSPNPINLYYLEGDRGRISRSDLKSLAEENSQFVSYRPQEAVYLLPRASVWLYLEQDGIPLIPSSDGKITGIAPQQLQVADDQVMTVDFEAKGPQRVSAKDPIQSIGFGEARAPSKPLTVTVKLQRS